jgi:hypothetical protein
MVNKDGYLDIPNKPGCGVELNEEALAKMPPPVGAEAQTSVRMDRRISV